MSDSYVGSEDLVFSFGEAWSGQIPPPFLVAANSVRLLERQEPRILILGFGLGAMARLILARRPRAGIVGVEPDSEFFAAALRELEHSVAAVELLKLSAGSYLQRVASSAEVNRFDLVIDDCFEMRRGEPRRPVGMNRTAAALRPLLRDRGSIVVRNLLRDDGSIVDQTRDLREIFPYHLRRSFRDWENVLLLARRKPFPGRARQLLRWR